MKRIVREGYDRVSHAYWSHDRRAYEPPYAAWIQRLRQALNPRPRVLDLGCGCGVPVAELLARFGTVTGVDLSPVQVERARTLVPAGRFLRADMTELALPDESFDAVVALYSIIHVPLDEQEALFGRIARWLAPGGTFMATLGSRAWTGIEEDWLGVAGATMAWSHADAATYRAWLEAAGLAIHSEEFVPEGDGGFQLFEARRRR